MDYKVLYRKYRPKDFENFVGQDYILKTIKNAIIFDKISHAYIFSGPRGTGKTSMAKLLAKSVNCLQNKNGTPCNECVNCLNFDSSSDIIEIDAASNNGVDEIRELINNIKLTPSFSKYKVYIIDEVHMLSQSAFNALLLTLEEPPKHAMFILATTDIQNVPVTILSRCQRFDFKKISHADIIKRLSYVCKNEKINITEDALTEIAYICDGGMRDALSILDQLTKDDTEITIEDVINNFGTISISNINDLVNNVEISNINDIVSQMSNLVDSGINYRVFIEKIINELKSRAIKVKIGTQMSKLNYRDYKNLIFDLNACLNNIKTSVNPYLLIELVLLDYCDSQQTKGSKPVEIEIKNTEEIVNKTKKIDLVIPINEEKIEKKPKSVSQEKQFNNNIVDIRLNNCFVNAKKEFLNTLKDNWSNFKLDIKKNNKKLFAILEDSAVAMASDSYAVLASASESNASLINETLTEIAVLFKEYLNLDYHFIAISNEKWNIEKKKYIDNIKNNVKYELLSEEIPIDVKDEVQEMAQAIFGNKLEIQ